MAPRETLASVGGQRTGATFSERVCDAGSCHFEAMGWGGVAAATPGKTVTGFWMTHRAVGLALNEKGTFSIVMDMVIITVRTV